MIECFGFTSMVFLETMYEVIELSRNAWAFMMRSMFADQPYSDVVSTHGESTIRELTSTFSTLSPRPSFVVDFSFLPSNSLSCCTAYSSTGSTMYKTSRPFFRRFSRNGDDDT